MIIGLKHNKFSTSNVQIKIPASPNLQQSINNQQHTLDIGNTFQCSIQCTDYGDSVITTNDYDNTSSVHMELDNSPHNNNDINTCGVKNVLSLSSHKNSIKTKNKNKNNL